ncbi:hypothetical protein TNCV_4392681 [Trichonephila clavipes]|nr:hypothetical protein TNCV_4392681 [Trichonephila clavipes]
MPAVTGNTELLFRNSAPEPRKAVCGTADNRPVCFHCRTSLDMLMRYCRERLSLTTLETADGTSTTLALKYADQTLLAVLRQVHERPIPILRRYSSPSPYRRSSQSPGPGRGKLRGATFQGGEAACTGNPPSTAKMTGNQLDVIIDKEADTCSSRFWGHRFLSYPISIADFLKKVLFADAKSVMLKVADEILFRPIGEMCFYVSV